MSLLQLPFDSLCWEPGPPTAAQLCAFDCIGRDFFHNCKLITQALTEAPDRKLRLKEIYSWFSENHPYFKPNDASWQNSVRHNLSLNKCFINIPSEGTKGGFWSIDESVAAGFTADGSIPPTRPQRRRNRKSQAKSRNDKWKLYTKVEMDWRLLLRLLHETIEPLICK